VTTSGGAVAVRVDRGVRAAAVAVLAGAALVLSGCVPAAPAPTAHPSRSSRSPSATPTITPSPTTPPAAPPVAAPPPPAVTSPYPWHTRIVSTTFWVGEIFDPNASDGSQVISTYDSAWEASYGGCDGVTSGSGCETEARTAANGYFPTSMTPKQNPFYLDLPFDDINDGTAFAERDSVVPWAGQFAAFHGDQDVSYMKNRWVELRKGDRTCFGQIEDAGPGEYHDAAYVFGGDDARPANRRYNGAGMDVSPALNGCLGFAELNGEDDQVDWRFIEAAQVPAGPWLRLVTTSGVRN
jgi:hypothetical protein